MSVLQQNLINFEAHCELDIEFIDDEISSCNRTFLQCIKCKKPTFIHDLPIGDVCESVLLSEEQVRSIVQVISENESFKAREKEIKAKKVRQQRTCQECDIVFKSKREIDTHMESVHTRQGYNCNLCDLVSETAYDLEVHNATVHVSNRHFECDLCIFKSNSENDLQIHKMTLHMRPLNFHPFPIPLGTENPQNLGFMQVFQAQMQQQLKLQQQQQEHQHRMLLTKMQQKQEERDAEMQLEKIRQVQNEKELEKHRELFHIKQQEKFEESIKAITLGFNGRKHEKVTSVPK